MIVRYLEEIVGTDRDVFWGNGQSRRFLLERDGMKYGLTDTQINAGSESRMEYSRHLEACYCVEGEGEVESDGVVHPLRPGAMYALDKHDVHILRAKTLMRLICVFLPALKGDESHDFDQDGSNEILLLFISGSLSRKSSISLR